VGSTFIQETQAVLRQQIYDDLTGAQQRPARELHLKFFLKTSSTSSKYLLYHKNNLKIIFLEHELARGYLNCL